MIIRSSARARTIKNFSVIKNSSAAQSLLKSLRDLTWQSETLSVRGLPIIVMDPSHDDLTCAVHTAAHANWISCRGTEALPRASAIDPNALRPALGWIALLEPVGDGEDFVCRLFGSEIAWRFDIEFTGRRASSAMAELAPFIIACCRACIAARGPVLVHCQLNDPHCEQGSCLLLPWVGADGEVARIMVVVGLKERTQGAGSYRPLSALVRFRR